LLLLSELEEPPRGLRGETGHNIIL
jgi:hypothetical protein